MKQPLRQPPVGLPHGHGIRAAIRKDDACFHHDHLMSSKSKSTLVKRGQIPSLPGRPSRPENGVNTFRRMFELSAVRPDGLHGPRP